MKIHCCLLDRQCRRFAPFGVPARLNITTRRHHIGIALTRGNRYESGWLYIERR